MIALPVIPNVAYYTFSTVIETEVYTFVFRWNVRDASWYFDCTMEDGTVLQQGVRVVLGAYLGRACTQGFFNQGVLVARDTSGQGLEAKFEDFGTRVELLYLSALDIQAMLDKEVSV